MADSNFIDYVKIEAINKSERILKIGNRARSIADFYFFGSQVDWVKTCIFVLILLLVCYLEFMKYRDCMGV